MVLKIPNALRRIFSIFGMMTRREIYIAIASGLAGYILVQLVVAFL